MAGKVHSGSPYCFEPFCGFLVRLGVACGEGAFGCFSRAAASSERAIFASSRTANLRIESGSRSSGTSSREFGVSASDAVL